VSIKRTSNSTPRTIFGARMRQARERLGLPQDKLGVMIGLDEETASARISRYETGVHEPQIAIARSIAKALKVPLAYLYCDEDDLASIIEDSARLSSTDRSTLVESIRQRL
jgi:transcriptional regulator with XRE-family HTH domain